MLHNNNMPAQEPYALDARTGWYLPIKPVVVRHDEYPEDGFERLLAMQREHFWYIGRHRFLYRALTESLRRYLRRPGPLQAVDLGGGCGGWIDYLAARAGGRFAELALGDMSPRALELAGPGRPRYQIDLLDLGWKDRWDVAFLLDVLEHLPDDVSALRQITRALRPGGLLVVACPALQLFWSYNDVLANHCRRYSRADFAGLAGAGGLELCRTRYFMFLLSPLLWWARRRGPDLANLTPRQARNLLDHTHRVPAAPINSTLAFIFSAETPLGWHLPFPWGTSIVGIFRKPNTSSV